MKTLTAVGLQGYDAPLFCAEELLCSEDVPCSDLGWVLLLDAIGIQSQQLDSGPIAPTIGLYPPCFPGATTFPAFTSVPTLIGSFPGATLFPGFISYPNPGTGLRADPVI